MIKYIMFCDISFNFYYYNYNILPIDYISLFGNCIMRERQELVWKSLNHIPLFVTSLEINREINTELDICKPKNIKFKIL